MGKRTLLFILGMLLLIGSAGCSTGDKKASEPKKVLKVGTSPDFSPFEFMDEKNQMTGFDIELIQALGKQMNAEINLQNLSFDGLIPALQAGNLDAIISGVTITPEREKAVLFTEPYYQSGLVAAVRVENQEIKGWDDLKGKRIAVQIGSTGAMNAEKIEGATVRSFNLSPDTFLELKNGGVDAVVNDLPVVQYFIKNHGAKDFKIVGSLVVFGLMLWFIFIAKVLIFGAILNAVYLKRNNKIENRRGEIKDIIKNVNSRINEEKTSSE